MTTALDSWYHHCNLAKSHCGCSCCALNSSLQLPLKRHKCGFPKSSVKLALKLKKGELQDAAVPGVTLNIPSVTMLFSGVPPQLNQCLFYLFWHIFLLDWVFSQEQQSNSHNCQKPTEIKRGLPFIGDQVLNSDCEHSSSQCGFLRIGYHMRFLFTEKQQIFIQWHHYTFSNWIIGFCLPSPPTNQASYG